MDPKDALKNMEENPELAMSLEAALGRNAGEQELYDILVDAGIDAAEAESLIAEYQQKRAVVIAAQELDDDELDKVAGGGTAEYCASSYDCDQMYQRPAYFNVKHCSYSQYCDEAWEKLKD